MKTENKTQNEKNDIPSADILLVKDKTKNEVEVVKAVENGELQTLPARKEYNNQFLKINGHRDILDNFFTNFISQVKDPTRFSFFKGSSKYVEKQAKNINEALERPTKENQKLIDNSKIDLPKQTNGKTQEQKKYYIDPGKVNWEGLKKIGVSKEILEKSGVMDELLMGNKSSKLFNFRVKVDNTTIDLKGKLRLAKDKDGNINFKIHGVREKPELHRQFFGHTFTEEDKKNLLETGNMGRAVYLKDYINNREELSLISLDKLTNETVAMQVKHIRIPDELMGMKISPEQKLELKLGKRVELKTDNPSKPNLLQLNASTRKFDFSFPQKKQKEEISNKNEADTSKKNTKAQDDNMKNRQDKNENKPKRRKTQKI